MQGTPALWLHCHLGPWLPTNGQEQKEQEDIPALNHINPEVAPLTLSPFHCKNPSHNLMQTQRSLGNVVHEWNGHYKWHNVIDSPAQPNMVDSIIISVLQMRRWTSETGWWQECYGVQSSDWVFPFSSRSFLSASIGGTLRNFDLFPPRTAVPLLPPSSPWDSPLLPRS
jgi:hypothetical protein